jgi:tRNA A-37 threonylcarbamoyl transferase component Bud32/tetratricopeptide (TPR) repeat protein
MPRREFGDYELLEEIARGGMGVVYRARQRRLNRIVAVKMILAGQLASEEEVRRFYTEAEAAARLDHAGIVPIYEVNCLDGQHYFSMGYVDGSSLAARVAAGPVSAREAAELVKRIAEAVHYAHEHGVIHRDLKPQNILLTSDGQPKVTDFGLAKNAGGDSNLTASGQVLGTPSYMAPEQAAGKMSEVGPRSDIYSLGAILYFLLTGRPPFQGATVLETLSQVQSQELVPPSRWKQKLHRDLETICLKALSKSPAQRYATAAELASDLERFNAGEPILGRRERAAARLWRRIRRNPALYASMAAAVIGVAVASLVLWRSGTAYQIAELRQQFESGLDVGAWNAGRLQGLEELVARLGQLDADQAGTARQRLVQRFGESIREAIRQPKVSPEQMAAINASIDLMAARDAEAAQRLRAELETRAERWELDFRLAAPFDQADVDRLFAGGRIHADAERQLLTHTAARSDNAHLASITKAATGNVELKVVFGPAWETASRLGLAFIAGQENSYSFVLRVPTTNSPGTAKLRPTETLTFAGATADKTPLVLEILRNQSPLRELDVSATGVVGKDLTLTARREGDLLTLQINQQPPLVVRDLFALSGSKAGNAGVEWPPGATVRLVQMNRQALPSVPSALEQGDDLYVRGEYEQALDYYREAAITAAAGAVPAEARFKEGLCLVALRRAGEAVGVFAEVASRSLTAQFEDDRRWSLLADCQLLRHYLEQGRLEDADNILDKLAAQYGYSFEKVSVFIPEETRRQILSKSGGGGANLLFRKPELLARDMERVVKIQDLLASRGDDGAYSRFILARAYSLCDRAEDALRVIEKVVQDHPHETPFLEEYCWVLRRRGDFQRALDAVNQTLARGDGYSFLALLERSRIHACQQNWEAADQDLQALFARDAEDKPGVPYLYYSAACLVHGFVREELGDAEGAQAAWSRGVLSVWQESHAKKPFEAVYGSGSPMVHNVILGSLTGRLTDAEAAHCLNWVTSFTAGNAAVSQLPALVNPPPAVWKEMWRRPRGRMWARKIAYRDLTLAEFVRVPVYLTAAETIRLSALPNPPSQAQEEVMWNLVADMHAAYLDGRLRETHAVPVAFTWKGTPNVPGFGWKEVAATLDPPLRSALAYMFAQRYFRLGKAKEAADFLRTAVQDAPPDSDVRRLGEDELRRLGTPQ